MANPAIQKSIVLFYDNESMKTMAIKLNEYVAGIEKRISDLENEKVAMENRIDDLEIKL